MMCVSGVGFVFVSTIFEFDFGPVPTVCYYFGYKRVDDLNCIQESRVNSLNNIQDSRWS